MRFGAALLLGSALVGALGEKVLLTETPKTFTYKIHKQQIGDTSRCTVLFKGYGQMNRLVQNDNDLVINRRPQSIVDHDGVEAFGEYIEVYGNPERATDFLARQENCMFNYEETEDKAQADEVTPVVTSGPPSNRIDVVFMGDGYTASEKQLHFDDMARLTKDMFNGDTFSSYLPLFNIWAVYRESQESGIGYYSTPKKTAFGLYRDGTELRGVYTSKPSAAREACRATGPDACDFPSLIANDPYYGGLGGEFTISTASHTTGTIVLRHEFGHNFGGVGEEYDGGSAYWGANFNRLANPLPWSHWLTDPNYSGPEQNALRVQNYAWSDLGKGPYTINFSSDGKYSRWMMRFSVSGCEKPDSLILTLDGVRLNWTTSGLIDRSFFEYFGDGFSAGSHRLVFESGFPPEHDMIRQLCSVSLIEYKNETEYHFDNDFIGAYPTYRQGNSLVGYRPNNERCLMRNMTSTKFCVVCQENNWLQFLAKMTLLDGVTMETSGSQVTVTAEAVPLAQFREGGPLGDEEYIISWTQNGRQRTDLNGRFSFTEARSSASGSWQVNLEFKTSEVRSDPKGLLKAAKSFTI